MQELTPIRRFALAALIAGVFWFCYFSHLDAIGLVGPDEPRYTWVARDMAATGDWVTPRLYGKPWFEKPILYYWGAALAYRGLGDTEIAARLPSAVAAALATLALGWAALRLYGAGTAIATLLILPTTVGMTGFGRAATPDMLFNAMLALALVAASHSLGLTDTTRPCRLSLMAFGAFLGAATLAKGPAAVVLAGGSATLWALATRRWRNVFWLAHPWAMLTFAVVALPWYVACAMRNPEFVDVFLISHNFERFFTPVFQHVQPFWFFGPTVLAGILPWTILLLGVGRDAVRAWREKRWRDSTGFFFACWVIFPVVFFSLSKSKLPGYVLPVIPALVLLLARSIARLIEEKHFLARWLLAGIGITFMALAVGAGEWLRAQAGEFEVGQVENLIARTLILLIAGIIPVLIAVFRKSWLGVWVCALLFAITVETINRRILPDWELYVSARPVGRFLRVSPEAANETCVFRLHRAWKFGLNYYAARELPEWTPLKPQPVPVLTNPAGENELRSLGVPLEIVSGAWNKREAYLVVIEDTSHRLR